MLSKYLVCLSYLLFISDIVQCQHKYTHNHEAGGWLKLHTFPVSWEQAFLTCHREGAVLASPLNRHLANALHSMMYQNGIGRIFLGTSDLLSQGRFVSVEGVPLRDMYVSAENDGNEADDRHCYTTSVTEQATYMNKSSCDHPTLPYICYRKDVCGAGDDKYYLNKETGSCYKLHLDRNTWPGAYDVCADEGGHLVILNDKEEARVVQNMFPLRGRREPDWDGFHIGLKSWGEDRIWMTIHGERFEDVFHDWSANEPNGVGREFYGVFMRNGYLNDGTRDYRARFVCEKTAKL